MADYLSALNTSLGDYISLKASQEGISKEELEKRLTIKSIRVRNITFADDPKRKAVIDFNEIAKDYDNVVEFKERLSPIGFFGALSSCIISGTGIKQN